MNSKALNPDNKRFLENFPQSARSTISNQFLEPIRSGITDPAIILRHVFKGATERKEAKYADAARIEREDHLQKMLRAKYADALSLAEYYVAYESLPPSEKQRIKSGNAGAYVAASMQEKPVTDAQRGLLLKLGWDGPLPADRKAASEAIDHLLKSPKTRTLETAR